MNQRSNQPHSGPATAPVRIGSSSGKPLTVNAIPRHLNVYTVTEDELETLYTAGNYKTLDVGLFSLSLGVLVTVLVTLGTVDIANARVNAIFWAVLLASVLASIFFGARAVIAWRSAARKLASIKQTTTP